MGDRTTVNITIRTKDFHRLLKRYFNNSREAFLTAFSPDGLDEGEPHTEMVDYEANYGEWESLETFLVRHKIEFDKHWDAGGNYSAGSAYGRRINRMFKVVQIYETEERLLEFLEKVRAIKSREKVMAAIESAYREITPHPIPPLVD
jgi:hypothetical protein